MQHHTKEVIAMADTIIFTTHRTGDQYVAENDAYTIPMKGDHPGPVELLVASLGGCAALTLEAILEKKRITVQHIEVETKAEYVKDPRRIGKVRMTFRVRAEGLTEKELQSTLKLSERYCPVHQTLTHQVDIEATGEILT